MLTLKHHARTGMAVLAAAALVLTGTSTAGAATSPATSPGTTLQMESSGYAVHGNGDEFRFVTASFTIPTASQTAADMAIDPAMGFTVHLADGRQSIVLGVSDGSASSSTWFGGVAQEYVDKTVGYSNSAGTFTPGETVKLSIYYDQSAGDVVQYTVTGNGIAVASGSFPAWTSESAGGGPFGTAFAGMDFSTNTYVPGAPITRPASDTRLAEVTGTGFTTYSGIHGTVTGFPASQLVYGTSLNNVQVNAPVLFDGGASFGVWARK